MSDEKDEDKVRRMREMRMFAAFAAVGIDHADSELSTPTPLSATPNADERESEASVESKDDSDEKDEDEIRRMREIKMFAALAAGGTYHAESVSSTLTPSSATSNAGERESQAPIESKDDSASLFSKALNNVEDSGTFAVASSPSSGVASSNLQAAVEALTGEAAAPLSPQQKLVFPQNNAPTKLKKSIPMHSEIVALPRPLCFGPLVPPRVLAETRKIVGNALKEAKGNPLPPHVENLIGSIKVFGYGLSPYPTTIGISESDPRFYTGTPYITTIQPVWGNDVRSDREEAWTEKTFGRKPKSHIRMQGRSLTLPTSKLDDTNAFLSWACPRTDFSPQRSFKMSEKEMPGVGSDETSVFTKWVSGANVESSLETSTAIKIEANSPARDRKQFPKWAKGADSDVDPLSYSSESLTTETSDTDRFLQLARGHASHRRRAHVPLKKSLSAPMPSSEQNLFSKWARGEDIEESSSIVEIDNPTIQIETELVNIPPPSKEQAQFSQWALGGDNINPSGSIKASTPKSSTGTLLNIPQASHEDSDDDSVVGSEMKKKVGVNEHMDAALASLTGDQTQSDLNTAASESISAEQAQTLLSQLGQTTPGGRPLSNLELTGGCVPLFGCDDPALPSESDLGIYDTREDQQRCAEKRREQDIIEKHTVPDIFGTISCPNPAVGPDDNHSSNLRTVPARKSTAMSLMVGGSNSGGSFFPNQNATSTNGASASSSTAPSKQNSINSPDAPILPTLKRQSSSATGKPPRQGKKMPTLPLDAFGTVARFGWWNVRDEEAEVDEEEAETMPTDDDPPLLNPRTDFDADSLLVNTRLEPTPAKLREENAPLSRLHSATTVASYLPFLSDRPPSWRYLQIDTKAIRFSELGGEIEPLFCSLAIYHVETMSTGSNDNSSVPIPNLQRCGRVTEVLHFDVGSDVEVEERCLGALWPYQDEQSNNIPEAERTQGTRCGVFPIPSNLNIANLYAIIVVQRVLSDKGDLEAYTKQDQDGAPLRSTAAEREKYREKAQKASERQGMFLMPFAFGVAPLLQVLRIDTPVAPTNRAVQLPLFQFRAGLAIGERQIIDHIMVMLYPRANLERAGITGPAPSTNGGTVLLHTRYVGYLGLHSVLHSKGAHSRRRLVDFTGERQIRKSDGEKEVKSHSAEYIGRSHRDYVVDSWRVDFVSEPTVLQGRNVVPVVVNNETSTLKYPCESTSDLPASLDGIEKSSLYAQELAAIPLQVSPTVEGSMMNPLRVGRGRYGMQSSDAEPYFHTAFCNELLCTPRLVHNCPKGNIVTKIELREVQWDEELNSHVARLPDYGPCIHNQRRGPVFVSEAFTSCSFSSTTVSFLSEVKVKLPLTLCDPDNPSARIALFFSVYHVEIKPKKTWAERGKILSKPFGGRVQDSQTRKKCALRPLGCGYLPITYNAETSCLIDNGFHDVRLCYDAKQTLSGPDDEIVLTLKPESQAPVEKNLKGRNRMGADAGDDDSDAGSVDEASLAENEICTGMIAKETHRSRASSSGSQAFSDATSDQIAKASAAATDQMSLQVRVIVHSSLHPQNATLAEFLQVKGSSPQPLSFPALPPNSPWKLGRNDLMAFLSDEKTRAKYPQQSPEHSQKILDASIGLTKSGLCSNSSLATHSLRIVERLLTTIVCGTGEPSLSWANPAMTLPLRVHAFSTFLHFIHNVTNHLSKNGLKQLDGKAKWNVTSFGTIIAALFDECTLFASDGEDLIEHLDNETWDPSQELRGLSLLDHPTMSKRSSSGSRRRHSRSDSDSLIFSSESIFGSITKEVTSPAPKPVQRELGENHEKEIIQGSASKDDQTSFPDPAETPPRKLLLGGSALSLDTFSSSRDGSDQLKLLANSGFGGPNSSAGRRKFMTLPSNALATICEDNDANQVNNESRKPKESTSKKEFPISTMAATSPLDNELVRRESSGPVRQMRVPKLGKQSPAAELVLGTELPFGSHRTKKTPTSDEEIESAGTAFLDLIGESLGYKPNGTAGEEKHVGHTHHRKTDSKCSIDWTLPSDDHLLKQAQSMQAAQPIFKEDNDPSTSGDKKVTPATSEFEMWSLQPEIESAKKFPSYLDRVLLLSSTNHPKGRWFPYVYEVLIFQWVAILTEQRRHGNKRTPTDDSAKETDEYISGASIGIAHLRDAAVRARGCAVACAPVLLELIKKSIGSRLHVLLRQMEKHSSTAALSPPLIVLDDVILNSLEKLVTMVTDACIDSRNFDSKEFQQVSIDVNDAIIRFLRDMFAFLHPKCVHHLVLVYFSRFVVKDGKHWQDRDSKIGLRCSWEICKLRLNAVTAFIRLPDFVRVNAPQMGNWNFWPLSSDGPGVQSFFDRAMETFITLGIPGFATADGPNAKAVVNLPRMKPHWLSELVLDICLSGTEHAEQKIQHRASSLLHELFWSHSLDGKSGGTSSMTASMYVSFLWKALGHNSYLSSLHPKSQLRKDLLPCVVFVLQSAPVGLLQAFWRKLCRAAKGNCADERFGPVSATGEEVDLGANAVNEPSQEPHILDMFSLLNLALGTFEYGGDEDVLAFDDRQEDEDQTAVWEKEFMMSLKPKADDHSLRRGPIGRRYQLDKKDDEDDPIFNTTSSRKWLSHDGSLVVINACRLIVREMLKMLKPKSADPLVASIGRIGDNLGTTTHIPGSETYSQAEDLFSHADRVVFVRAAASVYLHSLSLRESDIVATKTLTASVELVKIFGIKVFLEALGETLQHWMRVVMIHCGARRANVRVQSLEFLALILRVNWDSFGSFFRIRQPLLAVQTEVMERIVAIATTRYYREQRRMLAPVQYLSNDSAEAALSMFWRTLDRLHYHSASQNVAFRSGVVLLAEKMKKLFRAYIAAHALSILKRARSPMSPSSKDTQELGDSLEVQALNQSRRISVHRIIMASAGYCKQFLGTEQPSSLRETVVHNEALEDAFLDAADVFSPTELPSHRVAWLQKLAEFHADRHKYAEEAVCHYQIQLTLRQAARLHEMIWSSAPFLPWTDSVHIDGEGPAGEPDEYYDTDDLDDTSIEDRVVGNYGRQIDKTNTFRRIFYRVANSVRMRTGDWEISGNKHLFYGVTFASEYGTSTPWMSLRELEERMIEAAEAAGELFLKAGIPESSRAAWGLATSYYAVRFNYVKLARAYRQLSLVVASKVPVVDTNEQGLDFSHPIGRFYRVWFHGGAPDDLLGAEFVYRAPTSVKLQVFGDNLSRVIRSILPDNTPIDLVLDDGKPDQLSNWRGSQQRKALGPGPLEPVKIKVTPLRPLLRKSQEIRGTPEWFLRYIESAFSSTGTSNQENRHTKSAHSERLRQFRSHHRYGNHSRSYSASMFGSVGSNSRVSDEPSRSNDISRQNSISFADGSNLVGADQFTFLQPIKRERNRPSRDWLKSAGDLTEKNLRVTLLQVERTFPACVARQAVIQRCVFTQSPLEAGLDAVCCWCSVLFRTAVATNGMQVLGRPTEHGIGNAASKVVADCVHSSRVKEIGQTLLKKHGSVAEETDGIDYAKLTEDEVRVLQIKLARSIVIFIEILHLLISRNRDQLLAVVEARKSTGAGNTNTASSRQSSAPEFSPARSGINAVHPSNSRANSVSATPKGHIPSYQDVPRPDTTSRVRSSSGVSVNTAVTSDRTDLAIAVQSELQRAFISLCRALYPNISTVLESETPRWLKQCSQDNYFSFYTYRQTNIPMADEVCFFSGEDFEPDSDSDSLQMTGSFVSSGDAGLTGYNNLESETGSIMDGSSVVSRGTHNHGPVRSPDGFSLHYV